MDIVSVIAGLILGGVVAYLYFYLRYGQRSLVDDLRSTVGDQQKQINSMEIEYREHYEQNIILREKTDQTLRANEDLTRIVGELSRYYYHIKIGSEKIQELADFLRLPDPAVEDKISTYVPDFSKVPERDIPVYDKESKEDFF